jgi:hypothetical protein
MKVADQQMTATCINAQFYSLVSLLTLSKRRSSRYAFQSTKLPLSTQMANLQVGCTFLSTSMFALAYCTEMNEVVATCGLWALRSTMLSTEPVSLISDKVLERERAWAVVLFRKVGDVGFLVGAMSTGAMADAFDMDIALHSSAGMLLTAAGWCTTRSLIGRQKSI